MAKEANVKLKGYKGIWVQIQDKGILLVELANLWYSVLYNIRKKTKGCKGSL